MPASTDSASASASQRCADLVGEALQKRQAPFRTQARPGGECCHGGADGVGSGPASAITEEHRAVGELEVCRRPGAHRRSRSAPHAPRGR